MTKIILGAKTATCPDCNMRISSAIHNCRYKKQEEYYLVSKETIDSIKKQAEEKLKENIDRPLSESAIQADACLDVVHEIEKSKLVNLSEKTVEDKARDFYWKRNSKKLIAENTRPDIVIGYVEAIRDLKNKKSK